MTRSGNPVDGIRYSNSLCIFGWDDMEFQTNPPIKLSEILKRINFLEKKVKYLENKLNDKLNE